MPHEGLRRSPIHLSPLQRNRLRAPPNGFKSPFPPLLTNFQAYTCHDTQTFEHCISDYLRTLVKLNDNQYGALCSWAFNVGCGNVRSSSLIKRLNEEGNPNTIVAQELPKWNKGSGKVLPGLLRRRAAEVRLFQTASGVAALPAC